MAPKRLWDTNAEKISFEILKEFINLQKYQINPHASLKEFFSAPIQEDWCNYHVDFIIADIEGFPVLGIEISGKDHWNDSNTIKRDDIKKQLFFENSVPLISIPLEEIENLSEEEYEKYYKDKLRNMIALHLAPFLYNSNYPAYCWACGKQYTYRYRNDHSTAFYCCTNKNCPKDGNKILSKTTVSILSSSFKDLITEGRDF